MKTEIQIDATDLRRLLNSINKTLVADDDADVHLQATTDTLKIHSRPSPFQISHVLTDSNRFQIETDDSGSMSVNIETLVDIMRNSPTGNITLKFGGGKYRVKMPEEEGFSGPLEFTLPRIVQSNFRVPSSQGDFHTIDSLDREALMKKLEMFNVLDEHVNIQVENGKLSIEVNNPVNGSGQISRDIGLNTDVSKMSQWYPIRPIRDFVNQVRFVDEIILRVDKNGQLCIEATIQGWESRLFVARRLDEYIETELIF